MTDFSEVFKNKLRKKAEELDYSNSSNFLDVISEELKVEHENNKLFQFRNSLAKTIKETKEKVIASDISLFDNIEYEIIPPSSNIITEEYFQEIIEEPKEVDFISSVVESISKEETVKNIREKTDLFNQPNVKEVDPTVKAIQSKVKYIEDWVSKISIAGPGGGSADAISLSYPITEVDSDYTMNRKDFCLLVNPSVKTYINLPPAYDERKVIIKDVSGHAHLTPIHINGTIDGDINGAEIRVKYASLQLIYKNNSWWII